MPDLHPKVSVIVPVYNAEKYLRECIESLLNQTLKDIEIICINDGSTDDSFVIMKNLSEFDKRIILINQKNLGCSSARNRAITIARGKYLFFCDSDDFIDHETLRLLYKKMEKFNLDMLSFSGVNFTSETREEKDNPYWNFSYLPQGFNTDCFTWRECTSFLPRMAVSSCLTMYNKSFIDSNSIYFPEGIKFEDNLFFVKAITSASRVGITKEKFYHRRIHGDSITQNWDKNFSDYIKISDAVLEYIKSIKIDKNTYELYRMVYMRNCFYFYNKFDKYWQEKYARELEKLLNKYKWKRDCYKKRITMFGIQIYKKEVSREKKRYFILGIPIYSVKHEGFKTTRRILFIRFSHTDKIRMLQESIKALQEENRKIFDNILNKLNKMGGGL